MTRRPARPVRALCSLRGRRHGRAGRGVGRAGAGVGRRRAPRRSCWRCGPRSPIRRGPSAAVSAAGHRIAFQDVRFAYPSRPGVSALNGVSFEVARRRDGGHRRAVRRRQEHHLQPAAALLRPAVAAPCRSTAWRPREVDLQELRARFALVPQDVALFDDTVAENIRYGRPDASLKEVRRAAAGRPGRQLHRGAWRRATTRGSASAASPCRAASASASRWPAPSCAMPPSCCSTRRPARSMRRARSPCRRRSSG